MCASARVRPIDEPTSHDVADNLGGLTRAPATVMERDLFWQRSPRLIQVNLLIGLVMVVMAWPHVPIRTGLPWFIGLLLCAALWSYWATTRPSKGECGSAQSTGTARGPLAALGLGMSWAVGALTLLPSLPPAQQIAWLSMTALLSALSISLLRSTPLLAMAAIVPAYAAIGHFIATADPAVPAVTATFMAAVLATLAAIAWQFQRQSGELSRLRLQASREEQSRKDLHARFRTVFEKIPVCMVEYNGRGLVIDCNEAAATHLQIPLDPRTRLNLCTMARNAGLAAAVERSLETGCADYDGVYYTPGGRPIHIRGFFHATLREDRCISGGVAAIELCPDTIQEDASPYQIAYRDDLTDLPNRRAVTRRLSQSMHRAEKSGVNGAIIFLDLDDFKRINDSLGHLVGDRVLQQIGSRLLECAGRKDLVARPGGDEFIVLFDPLSGDSKQTRAMCARVAKRMLAAIESPIDIDGQILHVTASAGIKKFGPESTSVDEIMRQVDAAMYQSKRTCKGSFQFHEHWIEKHVTQQMVCEIELRKALAENQFSLRFQPIVDAEGRISGAETLLRWRHPELGLRCPDEFIPTAEQSGLIVPIGAWVLEETIRLISEAPPEVRDRLQRVSVNISPIEFQQPDFVERIARVIRAAGDPADWLVLELTEGILLPHVEEAAEKMSQLARMGVRFEIDDFGTGYSSLGYLKTLPVSGIKIDRGFVAGIEQHSNKAALTDALISMAQELDLYVVAEGIENAEQHRFLKDRFCEWYQGFYWYKPIPWEAFVDEVASPAHARAIAPPWAGLPVGGKRSRI